jgi:hypothetical protein
MTAICKTIPIHGKSASPLLKYCANNAKTSVSINAQSVEALLDYGADPLKTICGIDEDHKELLITGIKCTPETAAEEFAITKEKYLAIKGSTEEFDKNYDASKGRAKRQPVIAIHLIQSFSETNIDPRVAHEIGVRVAESFGCQAVVDTHMNREHIHNHIILNAYMDNGKKVPLNKEFILNTRELSDEIQKEYGIPIEMENPRDQLRHRQRGTLSRKEWELSQEGQSWKDQMRDDIASIVEIAKNREEYLQLMESYGYKAIKESSKYITFKVEENGKKISDKKLGEDYTVGALFPPAKENEKSFYIEKTSKYRSYAPVMGRPISIAKYDANGRRRGLLELLIRKAIAIIQRIGNFFFDDRYGSKPNSYQSPKYKIEILNEAIDIIRKYNIEGAKDLEKQIENVGATLSHSKRNLRIAEIEKNLVETIETALSDIEMLSMVKTSTGDLHLHEYEKGEILKERAKVAPMTSKQKKDLSKQLALHNDLRLTCRFDEISCSDAEKLLNYFNNKASVRPDVLLPEAEFKKQNAMKQMNTIYERQLEKLKDKYSQTSPKERLLKETMQLLESKGIFLDKTSLTQYDVISIKNCFSKHPFDSPLISDNQKKMLEQKVAELGLKLNRSPAFITTNEFNHFLRYIERKTMAMPSFLGEREFSSTTDIQKLSSFMEAKGIKTSVPPQELSKNDFNKLYSFVICSGHIPECIQPIDRESNAIKDNLFYARVSEYNVARSLHLSQLRNAYNTLRLLGFNVKQGDNLDYIRDMVKEWNESYAKTAGEKEALSKKYSDLIKLKQTARLAKDPSFLYGDLFNPEMHKEIPVEEKEERDTRSEEEDKKYRHKEREEEPSI